MRGQYTPSLFVNAASYRGAPGCICRARCGEMACSAFSATSHGGHCGAERRINELSEPCMNGPKKEISLAATGCCGDSKF
jgi:hypothetical protein